MGIKIKIEGEIQKGYEIDILKEVIKGFEKGEKDFNVIYPYGQGYVTVTTE